MIDISLAVAANRAWYEGAIANDKYWWLDKADKGYVIDGFDGNSYQEMFHHKYMLELDGELQRTAYNAAPEFKEDGYAFLHAVRDPRKWVNNQDDVNGQKLNSYYLGVWPYPYWGEVETDGWGCGAYAYYKNDMLAKGVNEGIIPESVLNSQPLRKVATPLKSRIWVVCHGSMKSVSRLTAVPVLTMCLPTAWMEHMRVLPFTSTCRAARLLTRPRASTW